MLHLAMAIGVLLSLAGASGSARAEEKPLWELGLGVAPLSFPAYRGSEKQNIHVLPLPYVVYRGDRLQVDRQGIRGLLFGVDRVNLKLSFSGSVPVESDDSGARRGMPDLDPTFEVGPVLEILLARDQTGREIHFKVPARAIIATDFTSIGYEGFLFHPHFNANAPKVFGGWNFGLSLGPLFATREYHDYYYGVDPEFATSSRPVYSATGGLQRQRRYFQYQSTFQTLLGGWVPPL